MNVHEGIFLTVCFFELLFSFWNSLKKDEPVVCRGASVPGLIMLKTTSKSEVFDFEAALESVY